MAYLWLEDTQRAITDFHHRQRLEPQHTISAWMLVWVEMGKERSSIETAERLEAIAVSASTSYIAHVCQGVSLSLYGKLKEGLVELEKAIKLASYSSEEWHAYFWKGMICADLGQNQAAMEAIEKALDLDLPPILLTPLHWLEKDRPDFFREYAALLLARYGI